ncbi:HPr family phosphocarrier protein [Roseomonas marmotae]|uniref:HPr family phosphocarrier protein n=2 Tax=Roseomonas marmotae TaxID=2768161 RepID=A0ABS3KDL5_9PROT|nr:HPr family phosphocarrier protein [Roseomonas marmotae]QTI80756.1 HPr family phosphocarrier protein [Roseomonas marmotae]
MLPHLRPLFLAPSDSFREINGRPGDGNSAEAAADNPMVLRRTVTIRNSRGLHARAAAKLVTLAERFSACVNVSRHGQTVPACSIMGLMMLGAGKGSEVVVDAEGWDAKEALDAVAGLIEAGFHED